MTSSWSRSHLRPSRHSGDHVKTLHMLCKCCRRRCWSAIIHFRVNDCPNPQMECAVILTSFTEAVSCFLLSRLSQFVKPYLHVPKPLHALLYCSGDCAHHPAGFVILVQLALLSLFIILIFPIHSIIGTCKITQTVSDSNQHLLKHHCGLSGRQSCDRSMHHIVLLFLNRCLHVFNSLSCPSGLSLNIILNPFLFLFIVYEIHLWTFHHRKLLFGCKAAQCH